MSDYHHNPGKTIVAPEVLLTIARLTTLSVPGISRMSEVTGGVDRFFSRGMSEGVRLQIQSDGAVNADIYVIVTDKVNIRDVARNVQQQLARAFSEMAGMQAGRINIHIEDIDFVPETEV